MDLVAQFAAPEQWIRRGRFGRDGAPTGVALTFTCELGYTFDPAVCGQGFATEAARCVRHYARDVLRNASKAVAVPENAGNTCEVRVPVLDPQRVAKQALTSSDVWCPLDYVLSTLQPWRP
jgi:hypothetical protein